MIHPVGEWENLLGDEWVNPHDDEAAENQVGALVSQLSELGETVVCVQAKEVSAVEKIHVVAAEHF